jgi:NIPSNAP protein
MLAAPSAICDGGRAHAQAGDERSASAGRYERGSFAMIYELRVYRCVSNRMPALLKRFEEKTLSLWEKHGIRQAGFWTTVIGESNQDLTYFIAWESLAERERKWSAFIGDPAWVAARSESEKDGPIVANITSSILQPTSFSSVR